MRVRTSRTGREWSVIAHGDGRDELASSGMLEVSRHLSQSVRSPSLLVLAGLGTSLCVKSDGIPLAPTMNQLRLLVIAKFKELDDTVPLAGGEGRWTAFLRLARVPEKEENLETILSRAKVAADFLGGADAELQSALLAVAEGEISKSVDFIKPATDLETHAGFLRRIARRSIRRSRTKIYTTNYDRCFEVAAARSGFIVVDGFAFGSDEQFNPEQFNYDVVRRDTGDRPDYVENLFHLLKVHGSIDWEQDPKSGRVAKRDGVKHPVLIYPRATKYEMAFSQPYVDMMSSFQTSLRAPGTTLVVIGFGFNDKHIAEPILAAVRSNLSFNLIVVDPSLETKCSPDGAWSNPYLVSLARLADEGDGRIALVEGTFEGVVPLIPDVVAETDIERHHERINRSLVV